jgi:hypothetical protein
MATVFVALVLATFVVNAIITRSRSQWWRDPGSLFRSDSAEFESAEFEVAAPSRPARVRQPWEITPRQDAAPRAGRHAMRPTTAVPVEPAVPVARAVPVEYAETEIIARIPAGRPRHERHLTR